MADKICALIARDYTYRQIAKIDGMPSKATIIRWLGKYEEFETKCARAREIQADTIDDRHGEVINKTLKKQISPDVARVVLSAMQWRAAKKAPKKYGDSTTLKGDKENPLIAGLGTILNDIAGRTTTIPNQS